MRTTRDRKYDVTVVIASQEDTICIDQPFLITATLCLILSDLTTLAGVEHTLVGDAAMLIPHKVLNLMIVIRPLRRSWDVSLRRIVFLLGLLRTTEYLSSGWDVFGD